MAPLTPSIPLESLDAQWVDVPGRFNCAFSFVCPTHGPPCRLEVWLSNPGDGGPPPKPGKRLHYRLDADEDGASLAEITARDMRDESAPIVWHGHWAGWVDHGALFAAAVDPDEIETEPNVPIVSEP